MCDDKRFSLVKLKEENRWGMEDIYLKCPNNDDVYDELILTTDDKNGAVYVVRLLNKQDQQIINLKLENKILLEELEEIRDKINSFLQIKKW